MSLASIGAGFLAGALSTLSPCVLPLLPLLVAAALSAHRAGPLALAIGLAVSFTVVGLFVATIGFSIGLDRDLFRTLSAVLLAIFGVVLLSGVVRQHLAIAMTSLTTGGQQLLARLTPRGLSGQFAVGALLGMIWSPCVGPTLGAASVLAAQGHDLGSVALVMLAFGAGAATPLLLISALPRAAVVRWRGRLMRAGLAGTTLLGGVAVGVALLILTGIDHRLETVLVNHSPDWLTDLTTRF